MRIHCPSCGIQIPASDVNIDTAIAKCVACNSVFEIKNAIEHDAHHHAQVHEQSEPVTRPSGITVKESGVNRRIIQRWYSSRFLVIFIFCIFWDSSLITWYSRAFWEHNSHWLVKMFPIPHLLLGLGLTYYTFCGLLNRTTFETGSSGLSIRHWPLPWFGIREYDIHQIDHIHYGAKPHRESKDEDKRDRDPAVLNLLPIFKLYVVTKDGKSQKVLPARLRLDQVKYPKKELERDLGIADRPSSHGD